MIGKIVLFGGGGHASVVIETMRACGFNPAFIVDNNEALWGTDLFEIPIVGGDDQLDQHEAESFVIALASVSPSPLRRKLFDQACARGLKPFSLVHPSALVSPSVSVGRGSFILPGVIVNARAKIGDNVILNTRSVVEHDVVVGDHVHVGTGACLCGGAQVGDGAFIGAGSVVKQGTRIGTYAAVAMGAAVIDDVADGQTVMGVPAQPKSP